MFAMIMSRRRRSPKNVIAAALRPLVFLQLMPLLLQLSDATILTDEFYDINSNDDCSLVQCAAPRRCPADSRLREVSKNLGELQVEDEDIAASDPFAGLLIEELGPIEFSTEKQPAHPLTKATSTLDSSTERTSAKRALLARPEHRIWKREIKFLTMGLEAADADADAADDESSSAMEQICCPEYECVCDDCTLPENSASSCAFDEVAMELSAASGEPGSCCARFKCIKRWDCGGSLDAGRRKEDEYWKDECTKCRCFGGEELCADVCDKSSSTHQHSRELHRLQHKIQQDEATASNCYSDYLGKLKFPGETWLEDAACSECSCQEGRKLCVTNFCAAAECENPTKVEGKCCPVCESTEGEEWLGRKQSERKWKPEKEIVNHKELKSEESGKASIGKAFDGIKTRPTLRTTAKNNSPHFTPDDTLELSSTAETKDKWKRTTVSSTLDIDSLLETATTSATKDFATEKTIASQEHEAMSTAAITTTDDVLRDKNFPDGTTAKPDTNTTTSRTSADVTKTETITFRTSTYAANVDADDGFATAKTTTSSRTLANSTLTTAAAGSTSSDASYSESLSDTSVGTSQEQMKESHIDFEEKPTMQATEEESSSTAGATATDGPTTETKYRDVPTDATSSYATSGTLMTAPVKSIATSSSSTAPSYLFYSFGTTSPSSAVAKGRPLASPATTVFNGSNNITPSGFLVSSTKNRNSDIFHPVPLSNSPARTATSTNSTTAHNIFHIFHKVDSTLIVALAIGALLSLTLGLIIRHTRNKTNKVYSTIPSSETSLSQTSTTTLFTV